MSRERDRRIDADTAERLLDGEGVGLDRLESLLAAAAAPGRHGETAGEAAAVVAFRRARLELEPAGRARPTQAGKWARLLGVKAAAFALAVVAAGVALATSTGVLPNPFDVNSPSVDNDATPNDGWTSPGAGVAKSGSSSTKAPSAVATPDPSLVGLCRAYVAQVAADPGKALDTPAFAALLTAAGGAENVAAFCDGLLSEQPGGASPGAGNASGHPTGPPSGLPTGGSSGKQGQESHPARS